jgi:hypothetical protein
MIAILKKKILEKFNFIFSLYFNYLFTIHRNYTQLVIFDIDNTLTIFDDSKRGLILDPKLNDVVLSVLYDLRKANIKVILLSARGARLYFKTLKWAYSNNLIDSRNDLILVPTPKDKIPFLKKAIANNYSVVYYDDLSYNHEYGEVRLYEEIIKEVKHLNLTYHGLMEINQLKNNSLL